MSKRKHTESQSPPDQPQEYQPRVEVVVQALVHVVAGTRLLVEFLHEQGGVDWQDCHGLLRRADDELRQSRFWLRKELHPRAQRRSALPS